MIARILIDNIAPEGLIGEWGLSVWIEHGSKRILLDTGTTGAFAENARKMGLDLSTAEVGVISHAHYDHANGLEAFFRENSRAKVWFRDTSKKRYYGKKEGRYRYIGVDRGIFRRHGERLEFARGNVQIMPGVWLIPHSTPGLEAIAARSDLYMRRGLRIQPKPKTALSFSTAAAMPARTTSWLKWSTRSQGSASAHSSAACTCTA